MSLINQMLRDLDKRENEREKPQVAVTPVPVAQRSPVKRGVRWPMWILLAGIVSVVSVSLMPQGQQWLSDILNPTPAVSDAPVTAADETVSRVDETAVQITSREQILPSNLQTDKSVISAPTFSVQTTPVDQLKAVGSNDILEAKLAPKTSLEQAENTQPVGEQSSTASNQLDRLEDQQPSKAAVAEFKRDQSAKDKQLLDRDKADSAQKSASSAQIIIAKQPTPIKPEVQQQEIKPEIQVKRVTPQRVQESADSVYQTALQDLNEGRLAEAEASLRHVLLLDQNNHEARRLLAMVLLNTGDRGESTSLLNKGIQIAPSHAPFVILLSRVFLDSGENTKAVQLLERHLPAMGHDVELLALLGSLYQQAGQYRAAIKTYRQLLAHQPDNARAVAGLAMSLDASGEQAQALKLYKQALNYRSLPEEVSEYARQRVLAISVER